VSIEIGSLDVLQFHTLCRDVFKGVAGAEFSPLIQSSEGSEGPRLDDPLRATFTGDSSFGTTTWSGHHVLHPIFFPGVQNEWEWEKEELVQPIQERLEYWRRKRLEKKQKDKLRIPDYLVLAFNIHLSHDDLHAIGDVIATNAGDLGLQDFKVWHRDLFIEKLADDFQLRRRFNGIVTGGDVFLQLSDCAPRVRNTRFAEILRDNIERELQHDQYVRLDQSGASPTERPTLDQIAVDLPVQVESKKAVALTLEHGDNIPSGSAGDAEPRHFLIVGGPGQGKTTIGQMIAQTYRIALLGDSPGPQMIQEIVSDSTEAFRRQGLQRPRNRRWPVRLDLARFAERIGDDRSFVRCLARELSRQAYGDILPFDLRTWLQDWPSVLILDGLDEVAGPATREVVVEMIEDFISTMESTAADVILILTSRPQVLTTLFFRSTFRELRLRELRTAEAVDYANQLTRLRHRKDAVMAGEVMQRIRAAAVDKITGRLLRTPLQVTIIYLIVERHPKPPQARHYLFQSYFETIYARETAKPGDLGQILEDYKSVVLLLHERVALEIQISEETGHESINQERLEELAGTLLGPDGEGFELQQARHLAKQLTRAAKERLVLLTPVATSDIGYEIRSLREYMVARALTGGPDRHVISNLERTVLLDNWRNVWLLAAGRLFSERQHLRRNVVSSLRALDSENPLSSNGAEVAIDALLDNIAARAPNYQRQLFSHALELLNGPPTGHEQEFVRLSFDMWDDTLFRAQLISAFTQGIRGPADRAATTRLVLQQIATSVGELPAKAHQILGSSELRGNELLCFKSLKFPSHLRPPGSRERTLGWVLESALKRAAVEIDLKPEVRKSLDSLIHELHSMKLLALAPDFIWYVPKEGSYSIPSIEITLDKETIATLYLATSEMPPESWVATSLLYRIFRKSTQARVYEFRLSDFTTQE
jgi:hypothetical protein